MEFFIKMFREIFVASGPLAAITLYINMTPHYTEKERITAAKVSCLVGWVVLTFFSLTGRWIFETLGIGINSFSIASGLLFVVVGFGMLRGQDPMEKISEGVKDKPRNTKSDITIAPLGVPIIAGPLVVAFSVDARGHASGVMQVIACLLAVTCAMGCMYGLFKVAAKCVRWMSPNVLKLGYKLSALFMVALGVQLVMNGIEGVKADKLKKIAAQALPQTMILS
ncbi:MAG: MarC family protein [Puniceicoccales bacterium]|jgi:multiple antibiotic resistance protein|nr:MarC family protein [Puniceicoccales bacterium]